MGTSFLDVCRFVPTAGGTGSWVYSSAVTGYQSPTLANALNGATYPYRAESADLTQWEEGLSTYTLSTGTFARTTVLYNSSGTGTAAGQSGAGTPINFATVPQVAIVLLAENLASFLVNANNLSDVSTPATALSNLGGVAGGLVNLVRNGAMDIWQRGTGPITVATAGAYTADGHIVGPTGASCTVQQATNNRTGAYALYGLELVGATGVTDIQYAHRIESFMAVRAAGRQVTVQAQIYNNTGASITPTLATKYAGTQDVWTSPVADLAATNLQACANGAWTLVAYTFPVSVNAAKGYEFIIDFGNNFSTTGKDVIITEIDFRVTPGLATGLNSNPPAPELRNIQFEFALCQRYFQMSYAQSQAIGSAPGGGSSNCTISYPSNSSGGGLVTTWMLSPELRAGASLTIVTYDGAGTPGKISYLNVGVSWSNGATPSFSHANTRSFGIYAGVTSGGVSFDYTASAEL